MTRKFLFPAASPLALAIMTSMGMPAQAAGFTEALTGGTPNLDLRLRYENVDQTGIAETGEGLTLRGRLGYTTGEFAGFGAMAEFEYTTALEPDDFNSTANGMIGYPVIADQDATELNQAYLSYAGLSGTLFKFGPQRIRLDNERFVGNVGWRQNEQTFDAFSVVNKSLSDTAFTYAYLSEVNTFTDTRTNIEAHLLNATYAGLAFGKLTGYGYLLEFPDAPATSSATLGVRFAGQRDVSDGWKLAYAAEYAQQSDYQDGNADIDADYGLVEFGATTRGVTVKLGYELLGDDDAFSFQTPLATKHAFNGWADKFLVTPADGLEDVYLSLGGAVAGVNLLAVYHDYSADAGGADYGSEWDLLAAKKFGKHYAAGAKYASYDADSFATDTDKFWLWGEMTF
jgi:hypothetical protein